MAGIFDPKFIKDGNVTANLSFLATIKLPSLTSESSSLDFLSIAADNSIKKRSLGTMALLSAASFYDKTTADGTFLKLTGGVMSGTLTVNSVVNIGSTLNITGSDLTIRNAARGAGGRALVHEGTNGLSINYANDFTGGVKIGSNVFFSNTASSYLMNVNFGIGTATPSEKLAVVGNISMLGMFKLNAVLGTTGQFIKNTGTLSEWANITTSDITGLYLGTKLLMEDTRTSFGNGIYTYRTYNGQTTNNPTGLFYGQILNWGGGASGGQAQVAVGWTPSDNNYIAFRSLRDSTDNWYSWKRIYHEGYKPSVSDITGLATYNGLTNYLPLSGGTLSGTLTLPLIKISKSPSDTVEQGPSVYLNGGIGTSYTQLQQGLGRFIIFGFGGSSWEEKMTIRHSDGFIGIGTPNPIYRLDVNGTARFTGNVYFGDYTILGNNKFIDWNDTLGNPRRLLGLGSNGFHVGDVDNVIENSVTNLWAKVQHNFFVNGDLKVQLTNGGWNYFKGHIQAYGVLNTQIRTDSNDGIAGKIQSVDGNSVYMGSESNHYLNFITNNIIRATIDTVGNLGIGIATPQTKLHVGGGYGQLNGLAIGSLDANEYSTLLFTENYGNGVTHLFSLKHTIGYGDLALAEYGGRVGIGTDRPNVKLDVRGTIRIGNNGFVTGSAGSFMDIWHTNSTGNSQVNLQAWSNGGNTYDSIALQPLSGEVRIGTSVGGFKLNVGGNTRIDGYLRMGDNIGMENNKYLYWKDTTGTDRRFIGFSDGNTLFLGDIDRSVPNSNTVLISDTIWFYCGQANKAVITSSGLDVKGNYYQNGVLKTFFDGNYNSLSNLPNLGSYVLTSSIVQDELNVNATNSNAVAAKVLFSMKDNIYANMNAGLSGKANASHTHDWNSITGKPSLFDGNYNSLSNRPNLGIYVLTSSIVQDELSVNATNSNAVAAKVLFSMKDTIYANMNAGLSGKANASHTHDWNSITGKPSLFDGNYNNLSNRPTLFSGSYTDLSNKPTLFDGNYNSLINKPTLFDGNYNSLINKPTLFDGSYNSLSNLPNLNNFALAANTIPVAPYSSTTSNPVSGLYTQENIIFQSMVRMNYLYVSVSATMESSLSVAGHIWCDSGIRGTNLALSNPTTLLDYQVTKTSVEGVYVKVGNNVVKLTLTQFKNLMATV